MSSAVGSSSNSTNPSVTSSSGIDVPTIVSQLMTQENKPLVALQKKITNNTLIVSDLGSLKSKLANFQTALTALESPTTYQNMTGSSSNSSVATVSTSSGAPIGRYNLEVTQTAESSNFSISGFTSPTQTVTLSNPGFSLKVGEITYNSSTNYNVNSTPKTTGGSLAAIDANTSSLTDLSNWINTLYNNFGANVSSSIIQTTPGNYSLSISSTQTGITNALKFSGLNGTSVNTITDTASTTSSTVTNSAPYTVSVNTTARDSIVSINGLSVQRSSNTISDVVKNTTINLVNPVLPADQIKPSVLISISQGTDSTSTTVQNFITAYNAVISQYKLMIANPVNSPTTTPGSFADNTGMLAFVGQIKTTLSAGALTATKSDLSLRSLGMDLQIDGTIKFNQTNLTASQAKGLLTTLSAGISVGGNVNNSNNLYTFIAGIVNPGGTIDSTISIQTQNTLNINSKIKTLTTQLQSKENSYYAQYSKLNSLLFSLNQTSSQLTSALSSVVNINKG